MGACPCACQIGKVVFELGFLTEVLCRGHAPAVGSSLYACTCAPLHSLNMLAIRQHNVDQALFTPGASLPLLSTFGFFMIPPPWGLWNSKGSSSAARTYPPFPLQIDRKGEGGVSF